MVLLKIIEVGVLVQGLSFFAWETFMNVSVWVQHEIWAKNAREGTTNVAIFKNRLEFVNSWDDIVARVEFVTVQVAELFEQGLVEL